MVWLKNVGMKAVYVCAACGMGYADPKTALECEGFCKAHNSCSLEITKKAVYRPEQ
ncbi:MAG: hypothetical protein AB1529_03445 [Candidatus Micrarchaeota archaeon]